MMNYYYPVEIDDTDEAAKLLADTCLCIVTIDDKTALALTGGGMDLSWEICAAFIKLGFLPPLHFCDLPGMAGKPRGDEDKLTIAACLKTCEVASNWALRTAERIRDLVKRAAKDARKAKAHKAA
jgi:hypothetical protein